jgi:hypothetical protein
MDKQQTAVEWLVKEYHLPPDSPLVHQAKEMEKDQMIEAHRKGQEAEKDYYNVGDKSMTRHTGNSMEYYEQTYGGNK